MATSALTGSAIRQELDVKAATQAGESGPTGSGVLRVTGAGMAVVRGKASVVITGHGVGSVWVCSAEALNAQGFGRHARLADGVVFRGFRGTIAVSGRSLVVTMIGGRIDFTASGSWSLRFRGWGRYETVYEVGGEENCVRFTPPTSPIAS